MPVSPSPLKSALLWQGAGGQSPERQAKKAAISASVPMSPLQSKSALPQKGGEGINASWRVSRTGPGAGHEEVGAFTGAGEEAVAVAVVQPDDTLAHDVADEHVADGE